MTLEIKRQIPSRMLLDAILSLIILVIGYQVLFLPTQSSQTPERSW